MTAETVKKIISPRPTLAMTVLPDSEGNLLDFLPAETALQKIEDFFLPVVDDFVQPDVAVHFYKKSAVAKTGGDGVSGDGWIHGFGPDAKDFCFGLSLLEFQPFHQSAGQVLQGFRAVLQRNFGFRGMYAPPIG